MPTISDFDPMCQFHGEVLDDYQGHCDEKHDGAPITVVWVEKDDS